MAAYHALLDKNVDAVLYDLQFQLDTEHKVDVVRLAVDFIRRAQDGVNRRLRPALIDDRDVMVEELPISTAAPKAVLRSYRDTRKRA